MAIRLNVANNVRTRLSEGINDSITSITVDDASDFPSPPCYVTIYDTDPADGEIVEVTNVSTNTLTVLRGQQSTIAQSWSAGVKVALLGTAGEYNEMATEIDNHTSNVSNPHSVSAGQVDYDNTDSGLTATDVKGAIDEVVSEKAVVITQNITGFHWVEKGLMPIATNFAKATEYSGIGYYICPDGFLKYDATTDTWTSLNGPVSNIDRTPGITAYNGYIYIIGGQYSGLQFTCYKYEIASNTYTTISPMTADERGFNIAAITCNGLIYAGGGQLGPSESTLHKNGFYKYDPGTDTWTPLANLPESASFAFETDGTDYIYAFSENDNIYQYDIAGNNWITMNATFNNLYAPPRVKKLGNYIYILTATSGDVAYVHKYDIAQDTVTALDDTNYNHLFGALLKCQTNDTEEPEKIYVAGGSQPGWADKAKYVEEYNITPETSNIIAPITGIVRWNDDTIEGVTKNSSYSPSATGTAIFIGTTA